MGQQDKKTIVKELTELGKSKGSLTNDEIIEALGEMEFKPEELEKLYDSLEQQGIEIIEDIENINFDELENVEEKKDGLGGEGTKQFRSMIPLRFT